jgi:hypothetical protein
MSKVIKGAALSAGIIFTGGALGIGLGLSGAALAGFYGAVNALAIGALVSGAQAQLTSGRKPPRPTVTLEYAGTLEQRRIIYGEQMVSGMNCIPPLTSGTNNKFLHQVLALAGHEVNAITAVYFGQEAVGTMTAVAGNANDGKVTTGTFANKAWVRRYLGTATQAADYILDNALTVWTSAHQGKGVAYLALQYELDATIYKTGKPAITALVQGHKVYDPRLDSTNGGSGAHRIATPSTWAFSSNPALILAHYIYVYRGFASTQIDWPMVAAAADECDELVAIPTAATQKRYTCNTVLLMATSNEEHIQNMNVLAGAMLGWCVWSGGKWRISAGAWSSADFTLGDSNIIESGAELVTAYSMDERWNGVRGSFIDPAQNYQPNEFPPVQNATYVTADGGQEYWRDVRQDACTNVFESQRNGILLTRKSRNRRSGTIRCDMSAWRVQPGKTGIVTISQFGWTNQTVRCEGWKFDPAGAVDLTLREELSSDWTDPIEADYLTPLAISNPTPVYFTPDAISSLTVTNTPKGPALSWQPPALLPAGAVYEVWEYTAATPFASATRVWIGNSTTVTIPKTDTTTRYYWVLSRMPDGTASAQYPAGSGLAGKGLSQLDFAFVPRGNCTVDGLTITKTGGASAWDSDVYSSQGYKGGAFVSFRPAQTNANIAIGLNADPTTDSNISSIDFALFVDASSAIQIYESGVGIGSFGSYTAGDDFSVIYDGAIVRYLKGGTVLREVMAGPGLTLYLDGSFYTPGGVATDIRFGPYGQAVPVLFAARGNCIVTDTNAMKAGGAAGWDSDVYSLRGFTNCHVSFKANQTDKQIMVGLNVLPLEDPSYTSIDAAIYVDHLGNSYIYESGTLILPLGAYTTSTVFAVTYDGVGNIRYYKDGALQRTLATAGTGVTYYMDSSFADPGGGINSLRFGPTTNLAVADTSQIGLNAANLPHAAQASAVTITQAAHTPVWTQSFASITFTPYVTCVLRCVVTGTATYVNSNGAGAGNMQLSVDQSTVPSWIYNFSVPAGATLKFPFAMTQDVNCTAGVPITIYAGAAKLLNADTLTIDFADLSVQELRR